MSRENTNYKAMRIYTIIMVIIILLRGIDIISTFAALILLTIAFVTCVVYIKRQNAGKSDKQ